MKANSQFHYINEVNFKSVSNWSAGSILHSTLLYKEGIPLVPIGNLISRNREKEIIEDDKSYKQVTIRLYGKGVVQRGDDLILGKNIGTKNQYRISEGQFIMSKIDARNGAFGIVPKELQGAITTQDFLSYNINEELVSPQFFVLITSTKQFAELCQKASSGTTGRQRVDEKAFLAFEIPIPSIAIQEEIINQYYELLEPNKKLEKHLESELVNKNTEFNSVFKSAKNRHKAEQRMIISSFNQLSRWDIWNNVNELESEYEILKVGDVIIDINTGTTPPTKRKDYFKNEINFYTPVDLGDKRELTDSERFVSLSAIEDKKARKFLKGTLLFVGIGSSIGKIGIVKNEFAASNQQITGFVVNTRMALPDYVYYYFELNKSITTQEKTQATIPIVNQDKIRNIPIPLPPLSEQKKIVQRLIKNDEEIKRIKNSIEENKVASLKYFESRIFN